ncbi:beta-lactamase domain protein [Pseudarthrobacter chlorophenolicus A6]|uniref:Beta-lactamase domain protein n=1 Tax=Pseudarthrobacter chlorophenolicus (strain ATCC 700700 / DSM 12829 / CIP 107037 / JCM 12360 / KCTC 9906 / NCIMB 13794 / A6) TaxID=452863 RepID=B8HC58_PSECP|nr:MBL fold metallo-hydrolase [Pseudarthrobacter chlorophenolicus]ACL38768.1 beta-lactamase domain protein [Pseudarthrobacter chlorophenolicus A6]SDR09008.1 Glyoxylase, beta-lactamase superfamily II [Pseudarthrobacter chlorophenolicus]
MTVAVHPIVSPWGRFGLYSFYIDAPEPAIVDTGIASSPEEGMVPALEAIGRRIEDVRWILLTHGHIDHIGGAHALWELTGRRAKVVIHEADAAMLRSRRAHVEEYLAGRGKYLQEPDGEAKQVAATIAVISGEMEPSMLVRGGETLSLGGDVTVSVHSIPGHTAGSVAYVLDGQGDAFVGDAVQVHGAANGFPGFVDPDGYRSSLEYLRDEVRPQHLYLGHPYRRADGTPYGVELDAAEAREALTQSLQIEAQVRDAACGCLAAGLQDTGSPYSPFTPVATELKYDGDPSLEPSPFFTTVDGYRNQSFTTSFQRSVRSHG